MFKGSRFSTQLLHFWWPNLLRAWFFENSLTDLQLPQAIIFSLTLKDRLKIFRGLEHIAAPELLGTRLGVVDLRHDASCCVENINYVFATVEE